MPLISEGGGSASPAPVTSPLDSYYAVYGIDPNSPLAGIIRNELAGITDPAAISDAFDYYAETFNLGPYAPKAPTGGSGSSYGSTAASQAQAEAAAAARDAENDRRQAERDAADRAWREEQEKQNRLEAKRRDLLGTATTLLEGRRQSRDTAMGRASENAGKDVFRFLANIKGKAVPEGALTPTDIFKQQNAQIAQYQAPSITPDATIGDLESAIAKMQQQQQAESQVNTGPFAGMAMGGQINPTGIQYGTQKRAIMLGEGTGTGTEIGIVTPGMGITEVIPLDGGAEGGATVTPNLTVLPQLFQTLRQNVGSFGGGTGTSLSSQGYLTPAQSAASGPAQFGQTGALATPLTLKQGLLDSLNYTPEEAQQLSDLIGVLPAPHKAAAFFGNLLPSEQAALLSAYELAGFPADDLTAITNQATIRGPAATGVSLR